MYENSLYVAPPLPLYFINQFKSNQLRQSEFWKHCVLSGWIQLRALPRHQNEEHGNINLNKYIFRWVGRTHKQSRAEGHKVDCKRDWLWIRSVVSIIGEMKYLFKFRFPFLRPGVEAKRGVDSPTQNAMLTEFGGK